MTVTPKEMRLALRAVARMSWIDWKDHNADTLGIWLVIDGAEHVPVEEGRAFARCMKIIGEPIWDEQLEVENKRTGDWIDLLVEKAVAGDTPAREALSRLADNGNESARQQLLEHKLIAAE